MNASISRKLRQSSGLLIGIALTLLAVVGHRYLPERRLMLDPTKPGASYLLSQYGAGSPARLEWLDKSRLHYRCQVPKDAVDRNCVFHFDLSTSDRGVDLSRYQTLNLAIRYSGDARYLRIGIRNFDPRFSKLNDTNSPKFNSINLRPRDFARPIAIRLSELTVPEWWVNQYDMPREYVYPDVSNAVAFTVDFVGNLTGTDHEIRIDRIEFAGDWISVENWYLGILCLWMVLGTGYGISQWVLLLREHREQREKLHELVDSNAQLHSEKERYQKLLTLDALTKVLNRRGIEQLVDSLRANNRSAGVVVIDLDHFKRVNDQRGHPVGDRVLQALGDILRTHTRSTDGLGRWGGEEFVLICPGATLAQAVDLAEKLRVRIQETNFIPEEPLSITASFGVALCHGGQGFEDAFRHADQALYLAKNRGRNCVVAATEEPVPKVPGVRRSAWAALSGRFKMHN